MTKTSAINRIHELLDDNSFVEVGAYITAWQVCFPENTSILEAMSALKRLGNNVPIVKL